MRKALGWCLAPALLLGLALATGQQVQAQLVIAGGPLLVDLDASDGSAGTARWTNDGTLGNFTEIGNVTTSTLGPNSNTAINISGGNAYTGPASPASITGAGARSIEVWAFNPGVAAEESLVSWGRRGGPDGTNMAFNHGNHADFGAVGHWGGGGPDMGWDGSPATGAGAGNGSPSAGQWHQLTYVYDGTTARVYADGQLKNSDVLALNTHGGHAINVGVQNNGGGVPNEVFGNLSIGQVRVHDGALTASDVVNNFNEEAGTYGLAERTSGFSPSPIHRYSFDGNANDSVGGADLTLFNGASVAGGQLVLANDGVNNNPATGQYAELPGGTVSAIGGDATFEAWVTRTADGNNWQRVIDFGGGTGEYLFISGKGGIGGPENEPSLLEFRDDTDAVGLQRAIAAELPVDSLVHLAAVIDETNGEARYYVDGTLVNTTPLGGFDLDNLVDNQNWLGRSQFGADAFLAGDFDEFRIFDQALTDDQVLGNFLAGPNTLNQPVPEPASVAIWSLLGLAMCGFGYFRYRRKN